MKTSTWKMWLALAAFAAVGQVSADSTPSVWAEARSFAEAGEAGVVAPLGDVMSPFERQQGKRPGFTRGPVTASRLVDPERDVIATALNGMWHGNGHEWRIYPPPPHVPEAETWAMLGIGLLLLGALARRRQWTGAPRTASI